jgi:LysM repeat protein
LIQAISNPSLQYHDAEVCIADWKDQLKTYQRHATESENWRLDLRIDNALRQNEEQLLTSTNQTCNSAFVSDTFCKTYLGEIPEQASFQLSEALTISRSVQRESQKGFRNIVLLNSEKIALAQSNYKAGIIFSDTYEVIHHEAPVARLAASSSEENRVAFSLMIDPLMLPADSSEQPQEEPKLPNSEPNRILDAYKVESGDTLSEIAERHNFSLKEIMELNPLITNPHFIKEGWNLKLPRHDDARAVIEYIANEMTSNITSSEAIKMKELNSFSYEQCIADIMEKPLLEQIFGLQPSDCININISSKVTALAIWTKMVHQGGKWDHKPIIAEKIRPYVPDGNQHWHKLEENLYYYDTWSNIHYGYVGAASGFSMEGLLDGAGLEQIGSNVLRHVRQGTFDEIPEIHYKDMKLNDEQSDRTAITLGFELFNQYPNGITADQLTDAVINTENLSRKPY